MKRFMLPLFLLLLFWGTRTFALDSLPLHNDEGLHLTRAVEVWNLHPFWEIRDGKIINHWLIAAFYPQNAPVFIGRIATVFIAMLGFAAAYASGYRLSRTAGAVLAALLWLSSGYLFFYERLAFSDAEAGALLVVAFWACLRLIANGTWFNAALTGIALAAAALFKVTAAPYALMVAVLILFLPTYSLKRRLLYLATIAGIVAACFAVPLAYLALRGDGMFDIALGWIGGTGQSVGLFSGAGANLGRFLGLMVGFHNPGWTLALIAGILLFALLGKRRGRVIALAVLLPLAIMMLLGREVLPRHFVVALPLLCVVSGSGFGLLYQRRRAVIRQRERREGLAFAVIAALIVLTMIALPAYRAPETMPVPAAVYAEHFTDHSSGFGLREAMRDLPQRVDDPTIPIIGSMFPDSCRRANFYAVANLTLICTDAPGIPAIDTALADHGAVYVLADNAPNIGADMPALADSLNVAVSRVAAYRRPGEESGDESVVLWRVERSS
jgi:hypothetical protein